MDRVIIRTADGDVTEAQLYALLDVIRACPGDGAAICVVLGIHGLADRRADRALQKLRRMGKIRFERGAGWLPMALGGEP